MKKNNYIFPIFIIGVLFFIFGFITWANSQLIPYLKLACQLTETESNLVGVAFFLAYFFMAIPSAFVLKKTGFKMGMSIGLFVMAIGAFLFIPAAETRNYNLFLTGLFIIGTGLALLQTASNPYVAVLGPVESAARRISIMGICNKIAGIVAIYVLGHITLEGTDELQKSLLTMSELQKNETLQALANRVILPYQIISASFALVGIILMFIKLPKIEESEDTNDVHDGADRSIFSYKHLWFGVLALFLYVGVEVISYDGFSAFGESLGFGIQKASGFAKYTGYALLAGYIFCIVAIPKYIEQTKALKYFSIASALLVLISVFSTGIFAVICFAALGFTQSVMWPAIFPLAINKLGVHTKMGSAYLIMAIIGGAILLPLVSYLKTFIPESPRLAYLIMVPCYVYIFWYAKKGSKISN
ncbi:MAG: glucose/galactose MFS transporter [Flavobacteriales bacterium]|nr:MAG: glucose/galactose MFS transporter [Flavobacteriales bacterium]